MKPLVIGDGVIPEAQCVYDVRDSLEGHDDVVLLAHVAGVLGQTIPDGSTIYNLEPLFDGCRSLTLGYLDVLRHFPVIDYQAPNVEFLARYGIAARHVPYRYHAGLERVQPREKDIDVLFVGSMSPRRRAVLDEIKRACQVVEASGCYGKELDETVSRAKVVVNIHYCSGPHPLEVVRINYLMANGCCVVSDRGWDDIENEAYAPGLVFSDDLAATCADMLMSNRSEIEVAARETIRSMPMRYVR